MTVTPPDNPPGPDTPPTEEVEEPTAIERLRAANDEVAAAKMDVREERQKDSDKRATEAAKTGEPQKEKPRFNPEVLSYQEDEEFLAVANRCVPEEPETWAHPKNEKIMFAYRLPQMLVGQDLDLRKTSRDVVLQWIYVMLWNRLMLANVCKNVDACSCILRAFMVLPTKTVTLLIQQTIVAAGRKKIGSGGDSGIDGMFGPKTRGAIYSELCDHYDQTRMALHAQLYGKLQEYATLDPKLWGPVFQAFATDRI